MLNSTRNLPRFDGIPPGTDAGHDLVIAFDHLHRPAIAVRRVLEPLRTGLGAVLLRQPGAIVAPHARAFLALACLPGVDIDRARAPAVLDHEGGRRPSVERGDEIAGMPSQRDRDAALFTERKIVTLADIVEAENLHHDVMDRVPAGLDESEAVMARVEVQKARD